MALGTHAPSDAAARIGLLKRYFVYILNYEWGKAVAAGEPVGPLVPPGPTPATLKNWGALPPITQRWGVVTSRFQYLRYRHIDWQGSPSSARLYVAGGLLATAIGRTDNVFASGGMFVAKRVLWRLFRYEGENIPLHKEASYNADYAAIDPDTPGSWDLYRKLFSKFWADEDTGPYVHMLRVIQPWAWATYGVLLPDPF